MAIVEQGYEGGHDDEEQYAQIISVPRRDPNPLDILSNAKLTEILVDDFAQAAQLGYDSRGVAGRYAIRTIVNGVLSGKLNVVNPPKIIANKHWVSELNLAVESLITRIR